MKNISVLTKSLMHFCVFVFVALLFGGGLFHIISGNITAGTNLIGLSIFLLFFMWVGYRTNKNKQKQSNCLNTNRIISYLYNLKSFS